MDYCHGQTPVGPRRRVGQSGSLRTARARSATIDRLWPVATQNPGLKCDEGEASAFQRWSIVAGHSKQRSLCRTGKCVPSPDLGRDVVLRRVRSSEFAAPRN
jgi:hypothetical protein